MKRIATTFVLALAAVGASLASGGQPAPDAELGRIYREYSAVGGRLEVARLVQLDQELRRLLPQWPWEGASAPSTGYRLDYQAIGVSPAPFEPGDLAYSGKLLLEAHRRNPRSHRSYTLYSTVFGAAGESSTSVPSPAAAQAYLREFPSGPFALYAHLAAANFFADLLKVIQAEEASEPRSYKYDCFKAHIAHGPLPVQRTRAQKQAIEHYVALTQLRPDVSVFTAWLSDLRNGRNEGWHYCAD